MCPYTQRISIEHTCKTSLYRTFSNSLLTLQRISDSSCWLRALHFGACAPNGIANAVTRLSPAWGKHVSRSLALVVYIYIRVVVEWLRLRSDMRKSRARVCLAVCYIVGKLARWGNFQELLLRLARVRETLFHEDVCVCVCVCVCDEHRVGSRASGKCCFFRFFAEIRKLSSGYGNVRFIWKLVYI